MKRPSTAIVNENSENTVASYKKYKTLSFAEKINCLIVDQELAQIEAGHADMLSIPTPTNDAPPTRE